MLRPLPATLLLLATAPFSQAAPLQGPDVAIVSSAALNPNYCSFTDVIDYLDATGRFGNVDRLEAVQSTPTAAELAAYDVVLTWSNSNYHDAALLGDRLADFVDAGGGVVVAGFALTTGSPFRQLGGRWATGGYDVVERGLGHVSTPATLGDVPAPTHPILAGVGGLSANVAYRPDPATGVVQGRVLARWDDGSILVAEGAMAGRVDLGMIPPSSRCTADDWDWGTDGDVLVANALAFAAGAYGDVGASYCSAQTNSTGAAGSIAAVGSDVLGTDDLTLVAGDLPTGQFGLFVASLTPGFNAGAGGFSDGDVCVGGAIGRFNRPGEIRFSGDTGAFALRLDLGDLPQASTSVGAQVGETWHFQAWYRDSVGLGSNFTDAVSVTFQ